MEARSSNTSASRNGACSICSRPASIFERSRMSLMTPAEPARRYGLPARLSSSESSRRFLSNRQSQESRSSACGSRGSCWPGNRPSREWQPLLPPPAGPVRRSTLGCATWTLPANSWPASPAQAERQSAAPVSATRRSATLQAVQPVSAWRWSRHIVRPHCGLRLRFCARGIRKVLAAQHALQRIDLIPGPQATAKRHLPLIGTSHLPPGLRVSDPRKSPCAQT